MRSEEWWCSDLNNICIHTVSAAPSAFGISPNGGDK